MALIDRLFIRLWADSIAIPRTERMFYATPEFQYVADINSQGFRNKEFPADKDTSSITIAILGDSFTFGWGVAEEESWPRILENTLRQMGYPVVVMNLAKPGFFPFVYAGFAVQYLPVLKPDIVLVGVLQGDDLAQMEYGDCGEMAHTSPAVIPPPDLARPVRPRKMFGSSYLKTVINILYPHTIRLRSYKVRTQSKNVYAIWQQMAEGIYKRFSPEQSEKFSQLDEQIQNMFLSGGLNPSLVQWGILYPELHTNVWDLNSSTTRKLINRMSECLTVTKQNSRLSGAKATAVLSIPYGMYVSKRSYQNWTRIGLTLFPAMLTENNADTAISMACQKAGVPFISVTEDFRGKAAVEDLYFTYDGHFNAKGHAAYAALIAPKIINILSDEEWGKQLTPNYH